MKIVLIGYMGSGKSTVGALLAKQLAIPFIDLDSYIETLTAMTVSELFEKKGAIYFRKLERQALETLLSSENSCVLATGGGAPCYGDNTAFIKIHADQLVYLKLSVESLVKRLSIEKDKRPLIAHLDALEMEDFIRKHLFERSFYYNQANLVCQIKEASAQEIAVEIKEALGF